MLTLKNEISAEFIRDGENGFVVPKNDTYLLRKKLKDIMNMSDSEKQRIIDNAFESAQDLVSSKVIKNYIKVFEELISKYNSRKNLFNS